MAIDTAAQKPATLPEPTMYRILVVIGFVHLLNDSIQAIVPAMFPILEASMGLTFTQLGVITFALNLTASLIQPIVGRYTDQRPSPYALPIGLCFTFFGVLGLALAPSFGFVVISVIFIGIGSATFHPEGSRVANMAAGGRRGLAQSIYQVGGNGGQALAPLITALVLVPLGQSGALWFTLVAAVAIGLLVYIARWYAHQEPVTAKRKQGQRQNKAPAAYKKLLLFSIVLLVFIVFARSWFQAGITSFYAFHLIENYGMTIQEAQIYLFVFLAAGAVGTFCGGPLADRFGKRNLIIMSFLGAAPLTMVLPHAPSFLLYPLLALIGFIIISSFAVTVVYAQDLFPGSIGMASGLIVGLAFGMGAVGSIGLGALIDWMGITYTMLFIGALPILGILTVFLPSDQRLNEIHGEEL
ncbi:MFS transporter [Natribacillus halophilus]|uniref:MFS transporter, FSR family, fosmidomycin resistance protein n=1 Tax=Natribacillus halophilus TaxID=549003 RepID=A0A1G8QPK5_9BACI|nr:MFS transporter [Natribacillus halophilus]SDJ06305.1 MFS transporter, FSR family, fosmidomycin resistance protein [Natribacillus halophilus]